MASFPFLSFVRHFFQLKRNKKHPNQFHSNTFSSCCCLFFVPQINQFYAREKNPTKLYPDQKKNIANKDQCLFFISNAQTKTQFGLSKRYRSPLKKLVPKKYNLFLIL